MSGELAILGPDTQRESDMGTRKHDSTKMTIHFDDIPQPYEILIQIYGHQGRTKYNYIGTSESGIHVFQCLDPAPNETGIMCIDDVGIDYNLMFNTKNKKHHHELQTIKNNEFQNASLVAERLIFER